jgi:hypothetical protein
MFRHLLSSTYILTLICLGGQVGRRLCEPTFPGFLAEYDTAHWQDNQAACFRYHRRTHLQHDLRLIIIETALKLSFRQGKKEKKRWWGQWKLKGVCPQLAMW